MYTESKRARREREKEEKRQMMELKELEMQEEQEQMESKYNPVDVSVEFKPEELALATVPGLEFDPRRMAFNPTELKPQPIVRKRKKVIIYLRKSSF